jgi:hypothetical protein
MYAVRRLILTHETRNTQQLHLAVLFVRTYLKVVTCLFIWLHSGFFFPSACRSHFPPPQRFSKIPTTYPHIPNSLTNFMHTFQKRQTRINPSKHSGYYINHVFNIKTPFLVPTQRIQAYIFRMIIRIISYIILHSPCISIQYLTTN